MITNITLLFRNEEMERLEVNIPRNQHDGAYDRPPSAKSVPHAFFAGEPAESPGRKIA